MKKALILCENESYCQALSSFLKSEGFYFFWHTFSKTFERSQFKDYDFIFLSKSFESFLPAPKDKIVFSINFTNPNIGFWDTITFPFQENQAKASLNRAVIFFETQKAKNALLLEKRKNHPVIGQTFFFKNLREKTFSISESFKTCLFVGERGTGREYIARALYTYNPKAHENFETLNSKDLDLETLDKALHNKSSTLFLKNIEELSIPAQKKLTSYLQTHKDRNVWASCTHEIKQPLRLNEPPAKESFLENLYSQFLISLKIPSLSERKEDIIVLSHYFLEEACKVFQTQPKPFSPEALSFLQNKQWRGNVRELRNTVFRALFMSQLQGQQNKTVIDLKDILISPATHKMDFRKARDLFEKDFILYALKVNNGHVAKTAHVIGLERSYLHRKLKFYGLDSER